MSIQVTVQLGDAITITDSPEGMLEAGMPPHLVKQAVDEYKRQIEREVAWALPCPHCGKLREDPVTCTSD